MNGQRIFELWFFDGLTDETIARRIGGRVNRGTVVKRRQAYCARAESLPPVTRKVRDRWGALGLSDFQIKARVSLIANHVGAVIECSELSKLSGQDVYQRWRYDGLSDAEIAKQVGGDTTKQAVTAKRRRYMQANNIEPLTITLPGPAYAVPKGYEQVSRWSA